MICLQSARVYSTFIGIFVSYLLAKLVVMPKYPAFVVLFLLLIIPVQNGMWAYGHSESIGIEYPFNECGWWIPEVGAGPAYFGCTPPDAYTFAECQGCAEEVTSGDAYCESVTWDVVCNNAYNACLISNDYPGCGCGWWIPEIGVGPAYFGCTPADSYTLADCQPCAEEVVNNDQYCVDNLWDAICNDAYLYCLDSNTYTECCEIDEDEDGICDEDDECVGELDECDVCNGPGMIYNCGCTIMPVWACDCSGNVLDALGVCGGSCAADLDGDGICDDVDECVGTIDACGVCNGPGEVYDCGCSDIPSGDCDCEGNQYDAIGECGGSCEYDFNNNDVCDDLEGCGDPDACNYDPSALFDSGVCYYESDGYVSVMLYLTTDYFPDETTWSVFSTDGELLHTGGPYTQAMTTIQETFCLEEGCYVFTIYDGSGDGMSINNGHFYLIDDYGSILASIDPGENFGTQASFEFCVEVDTTEYVGCMDAEACNFNEDAVWDDGSCSYDVDADGICDDVDICILSAEDNEPPIIDTSLVTFDEPYTIYCDYAYEGLVDDAVEELISLIGVTDECPDQVFVNHFVEFTPWCGNSGMYEVFLYFIDEHEAVTPWNFSFYIIDITPPSLNIEPLENWDPPLFPPYEVGYPFVAFNITPEQALSYPSDITVWNPYYGLYSYETDGGTWFNNPLALAEDNCVDQSELEYTWESLGQVTVQSNFSVETGGYVNQVFLRTLVTATDGCNNNIGQVVPLKLYWDYEVPSSADCGWLIPLDGSGPAYVGCTPTEGYELASCQECADEIIYNNQFCVDNTWNSSCTDAYNACVESSESPACQCEILPLGDCDCEGNQLDAIGECGGTCEADDNDNGICDAQEVPGCMDAEACNFNPLANADDGTCLFGAECGCPYGQDNDNDGICDDIDECVGALDACGVCNGLGEIYECGCADIPEGDCDCEGNQLDAIGDCGGPCEADSNDNGICDSEEEVGCMDAGACNFNPGAVFDNGSCLFDEACVCIDGVDTDEDGVCDDMDPCVGTWDACGICNGPGEIYACGCTDIPEENCDCEGSQLDAVGDCGGTCEADSNDNGICDDQEVAGCLVEEACNFNPVATLDNGYCLTGADCECVEGEDSDNDGICDDIDDCIGALDACGICNGPGEIFVCGCTDIPEGNCDCEGNQLDAIGDCGGTCEADSNDNGICDDQEVAGCLDAQACNFNPMATLDNGSCLTGEDCECADGEDTDNDGICDDIDDCVGALDACGICNGLGEIYACGCADIPEGDCDCEGNQLDAIGDCGGLCEADADNDGLCDDIDDCVGQYDDCGACNGLSEVCCDIVLESTPACDESGGSLLLIPAETIDATPAQPIFLALWEVFNHPWIVSNFQSWTSGTYCLSNDPVALSFGQTLSQQANSKVELISILAPYEGDPVVDVLLDWVEESSDWGGALGNCLGCPAEGSCQDVGMCGLLLHFSNSGLELETIQETLFALGYAFPYTVSWESESTGDVIGNELEINGVPPGLYSAHFTRWNPDDTPACSATETIEVGSGCYGCTEITACNYNDDPTLMEDNTLCVFPEGECEICSGETDGTGEVVVNDIDNDGICDDIDDCLYCPTNAALCSSPNPVCCESEVYSSHATCDTGGTLALYSSYCESFVASPSENIFQGLYTMFNSATAVSCLSGLDFHPCNTWCSGQAYTGYFGSLLSQNVNSYTEFLDLLAPHEGDPVIDVLITWAQIDSDGLLQNCLDGDGDACNDVGTCSLLSMYRQSCFTQSEIALTFYTLTASLPQCYVNWFNQTTGEHVGGGFELTDIPPGDYEAILTIQAPGNIFNPFYVPPTTCTTYHTIQVESECNGCTDSTACNFNDDDATNPDNTLCVYAVDACDTCSGESDGSGTVVNNDSDGDGVCDSDEIQGCTDSTACNYDDDETTDTDNTLCVYAVEVCESCSGESDGSGTVVTNDGDSDGVCDSDEIQGCTDLAACNYDDDETTDTDNTLCVYAVDACDTCSGASDGSGTVLNNDSDGDGICDPDEIYGCTISTACNYEEGATEDDGSCDYTTCTCESNWEFDTGNLMSGEFVSYEIPSISEAGLQSLDVTMEFVVNNGAFWASDFLLAVCDPNGNCLQIGGYQYDLGYENMGGWPSSWTTSSLGTYTATVDVSSANLSGNGTWVVMTYNGYLTSNPGYIQCVVTVVADGVCADPNAVMGCTDSNACNYNPSATNDDGSCSYPQGSLDCDGNCLVDVDGDGICDEVDDCIGEFDACGVCNGPGEIYECGCSEIPEGDCDCQGTGVDALGECGGDCPADDDDDGICDDTDDCVGSFDACGVCNGPGDIFQCGCTNIPEGDCDCDGNQIDALGVCGGDCLEDADGDGICDAIDDCIGQLDACGVCNGPGAIYACGCDDIPPGACDCQGNQVDAFGQCGGDCQADEDNDGICDDVDDCVGQLDACGVCNGPGEIYACGCDDIPQGACDCEGNQFDAFGQCGGDCPADEDNDGICDDVDDCIGQLDACGVCNGPGAIFQCGCTNIAADECDCDGNQIDALGVCGGDCLSDEDGDGICDDDIGLLGCTYAEACNYASDANTDDGSCIFANPGEDCDGNSLNDASCPADIDGDGVVATADLLLFLSAFGDDC